MEFRQALKLMLDGAKVKLPSWGGYWLWDKKQETIIMHTKEGLDIDLFDTNCPRCTLENIASDEWMIADETNCPELGGKLLFGFDTAIKYLKRGKKLKRSIWGDAYIVLSKKSYFGKDSKTVRNYEEITFVTPSGEQSKWYPCQDGLLLEDWTFAD